MAGLPSLKKQGGDSGSSSSSSFYDHNNDELDSLYDFEGPTIALPGKPLGPAGAGAGGGGVGVGIGASNNTFSPIKQDGDEGSKSAGTAGGPSSPSPSKLLQFLEKNPPSPVPPMWTRPPGEHGDLPR